MNKIKLALLAAVAGVAMSSSAYAEGPYLSFGGGLSLPQDSGVNINRPSPAPIVSTEATFDMGYILSGAVGYAWSSGARTEFEFNYRNAGVNDVAGAAATGHQRVMGFFGNVLFDIGDSDSLRPYVGAGIGVGWNKWKNVQTGVNLPSFPAGTPLFNDRDSTFQWQAIAGLTHPFSDSVDGFVEYRYMNTFNNKFQSVAPTGSYISRHNDHSHNLLVGVRFNFGKEPEMQQTAAAPPPPPPPPPAPTAPPPPPVPQKFLVFFDFDRANLRADASKIVQEAADYAKKNGKAVIRATGHADTSGRPAYNLALSERRAVAVKAALVKMGFRESEVVVSFKGESEPLVATGDGVKEPQNRRVEIVME